MKHLLLVSCLVPTVLFCDNNQRITKDTVTFSNNNNPIAIIETTIEHFYHDSTCIWEVGYPEISGLNNKVLQKELNSLFYTSVSFGDCENEACLPEHSKRFPEHQLFWNKLEINCVNNDIISYTTRSGGCDHQDPYCHEDITQHFYDLQQGLELKEDSYFKKDAKTIAALDQLIITKLGFTPKEPKKLQKNWKVYFDCEQLSIFYECNTLNDFNRYLIHLQLEEIKSLINPKGAIGRFFLGQN